MVSTLSWKYYKAIAFINTICILTASCSNEKKVEKKELVTVKYADDKIEPKEATWQVELEIGKDESDPRLEFNQIFQIQADQSGNLYVLDAGNNRVVKLSSRGEYLSEIGKKGKGPGEFENAHFFDIDSNGRIYVYDVSLKRISIFDNQFHYLNSFTVDSPVGDMAVDSEGNIFLLLRQLYERKGTPAHLWKYVQKDEYRESAGKLLLTQEVICEVGMAPGNAIVSTMDTGPDGELFICFFNEYYVRQFAATGNLMNIFSRKIKKQKLPDFWRQQLEKEKANLPQELRDRLKIPEHYPNLVHKLLVDRKAKKTYIVTKEGVAHLKLLNNIPIADRTYIDRYDFDGNLEARFKANNDGRIYEFMFVEDGKFAGIALEPENDFSPYKIIRCLLNTNQ